MKIINLHGVVGWDINAKDFAEELENSTGDIVLDMNSGGGYIFDGVSIVNKIRSYDKGKVTARISFAASMMTQIAMACDEIQAFDNAVFMIHNAQGFAMGDHHQLAKRSKMLESLSNMLAQSYIKKTGKSKAEIQAMMNEETFLYGDEIVAEGFADMIIESENQEENKSKDDLVAMAHLELEKVNKAIKEENITEDKVAAFIGNYKFVNQVDNVQKKEKTMDLKMLEKEHPEIYAQAVEVGVTQERERVSAHLTLGEASGDMALAITSINEGAEMSATLNAKYMAAHMKNREIQNRISENVPDVNVSDSVDQDYMATKLAEKLGV